MASKRQKKKQVKQQQTKVLIQAGYQEKQVRKLDSRERENKYSVEAKKIKRKQTAQKSYAERARYIKENNLQGVKKTDSWKKLRLKFFENQGFSPDEVPPEWIDRKFKPKKKEAPIEDNRTYTGEDYLYIAWFDKTNDYYLDYDFYKSLSLDECKKLVSENLNAIHTDKRGSSGKAGHTVILKNSKQFIDGVMPFYEIDKNYQTLVYSNRWNLLGLYRALAIAMDNSTESQRPEIYRDVKSYVAHNMRPLLKYF